MGGTHKCFKGLMLFFPHLNMQLLYLPNLSLKLDTSIILHLIKQTTKSHNQRMVSFSHTFLTENITVKNDCLKMKISLIAADFNSLVLKVNKSHFYSNHCSNFSIDSLALDIMSKRNLKGKTYPLCWP